MKDHQQQPEPRIQWIVLPLPVWLLLGVVTVLWRGARWLYRQAATCTNREVVLPALPRATTHQSDPDCARMAWLLYSHLNRYRLEQGLPQMVWNERLEQSALFHARRMIDTGEFEHVLSDGVDLGDRVWRVGYRYSLCAENLALFENPLLSLEELTFRIHDGWVHSPGHEANLSGPTEEVGIGVLKRGYRYWAVQNFGTPQPLTMFPLPAIHRPRRATPQA